MPPNFLGGLYRQDIDASDYDVAFLHLDQWCDDHILRALPYRVMNQIAEGVPRVVIMHGTPDNPDNRERILRLIGDLPVVCNSYQAAVEWSGNEGAFDCYGLPQFRTVIHGYDVDEFWSEPLERRGREAVTICSGGQLSRKYHGIPLIERLARDIPLAWYGPRGNREWLTDYYSYRAMLARSLIYFSPTRQGPMPGARTEAMLSGCCIVTVPGNDVERFIEHGTTGFIVETYEDARDALAMLLRDPEVAWLMGQAGREAAQKAFGKERFAADWLRVLGGVGVEG
jgi:glycosyltransferase involved in cell wall biosynthesis